MRYKVIAAARTDTPQSSWSSWIPAALRPTTLTPEQRATANDLFKLTLRTKDGFALYINHETGSPEHPKEGQLYHRIEFKSSYSKDVEKLFKTENDQDGLQKEAAAKEKLLKAISKWLENPTSSPKEKVLVLNRALENPLDTIARLQDDGTQISDTHWKSLLEKAGISKSIIDQLHPGDQLISSANFHLEITSDGGLKDHHPNPSPLMSFALAGLSLLGITLTAYLLLKGQNDEPKTQVVRKDTVQSPVITGAKFSTAGPPKVLQFNRTNTLVTGTTPNGTVVANLCKSDTSNCQPLRIGTHTAPSGPQIAKIGDQNFAIAFTENGTVYTAVISPNGNLEGPYPVPSPQGSPASIWISGYPNSHLYQLFTLPEGKALTSQTFNHAALSQGPEVVIPSLEKVSVPMEVLPGSQTATLLWASPAPAGFDIHSLRVNSNGTLLSEAPFGQPSLTPPAVDIYPRPQGGNIIIFKTNLNGQQSIVAQQYDTNGIAEGTPITVGKASTFLPTSSFKVAPRADGGFSVAWKESSDTGSILYATSFTTKRPIAYSTRVIANLPNIPAETNDFAITSLGDKGLLIVWTQPVSPTESQILGQVINSDGRQITLTFPISDSPPQTLQTNPKILLTGTSQVLISWEGHTPNNKDVTLMARSIQFDSGDTQSDDTISTIAFASFGGAAGLVFIALAIKFFILERATADHLDRLAAQQLATEIAIHNPTNDMELQPMTPDSPSPDIRPPTIPVEEYHPPDTSQFRPISPTSYSSISLTSLGIAESAV